MAAFTAPYFYKEMKESSIDWWEFRTITFIGYRLQLLSDDGTPFIQPWLFEIIEIPSSYRNGVPWNLRSIWQGMLRVCRCPNNRHRARDKNSYRHIHKDSVVSLHIFCRRNLLMQLVLVSEYKQPIKRNCPAKVLHNPIKRLLDLSLRLWSGTTIGTFKEKKQQWSLAFFMVCIVGIYAKSTYREPGTRRIS